MSKCGASLEINRMQKVCSDHDVKRLDRCFNWPPHQLADFLFRGGGAVWWATEGWQRVGAEGGYPLEFFFGKLQSEVSISTGILYSYILYLFS